MNLIRWKPPVRELPPLIAVKLAEEAAKRNPDDPEQFIRLGLAYHPMLDGQSAEYAWRRAIDLDPDRPESHFGLARSLVLLRRFEEAIEAATEAINRSGNAVPAYALISNCERRLHHTDEAIAAAREALRIDTDHAIAANCLIEIFRDENRLDEAEEACRETIERGVYTTKTIALYSILLAELGQDKKCKEILDFDHLLYQKDIPLPSDELHSLNLDIVRMVNDRPELQFEPSGYPVKGGSQFLLNHEECHPSIQRLTGLIRKEVDSYIRNLDGDTPWMALAPNELSLSIWAVTLDKAGQSTCHIHHDGWISGVYYVEVPPTDESIIPPPGSILLGPPPDSDSRQINLPTRHILPLPGMLILFPSYIYHRTIPTTGSTPRTCIAFDVL